MLHSTRKTTSSLFHRPDPLPGLGLGSESSFQSWGSGPSETACNIVLVTPHLHSGASACRGQASPDASKVGQDHFPNVTASSLYPLERFAQEMCGGRFNKTLPRGTGKGTGVPQCSRDLLSFITLAVSNIMTFQKVWLCSVL